MLSLSGGAQSNANPAATPAYRGNTRAYLGVFLGDVPDAGGAIVGKVVEESPAARAGMEVNDVILRFEKTQIESATQVYQLLGELTPGSHLAITILRNGEPRVLPVVLGARQGSLDPCQRQYAEADLHQAEADRLRQLGEEARKQGNEAEAKTRLEESASFAKQAAVLREDAERAILEGRPGTAQACRDDANSHRSQIGINAIPLSKQLAQFFQVKGDSGLLISEVKADSAAAQQGLKAGDCLIAVNGRMVNSLVELNRLLSRAGESRANSTPPAELTLVIVRNGEERTLKFSLP